MRNWMSIAASLLVLSGAGAFAQVELQPDPTPRLPPQAGEGLPAEDQRFLTLGAELSRAEIEAGRLAAEKAGDARLKELSAEIAARHAELLPDIEAAAEELGVSIAASETPSEGQAELQRIAALEGEEFDREYLIWQLRTHLNLVELYQVQASETTIIPLNAYAIIAFEDISGHLEALQAIAAPYGIEADLVEQSPQY
jgi:predicted outer membrane protein